MDHQPNHFSGTAGVPSEPDSQPAIEEQEQTDLGSEHVPHVPAFLVLLLVFALCAAYAFFYSKRGWLPEDDGTLAQSALRVLQGQLPHRDFVETYTGGLGYLHALAFRLFGVNLAALRMMVLIVFVAWLPALFYIASRFLAVIPAGAVVVLAAVWGLPNYPAAMPSWYNLFFAVFGAAALLRYLESRNRRWLFIAGLCGGLSCLVKIIGLYYIAAVLLFFIFHEQTLSRDHAAKDPRTNYFYRVFIIAGLSLFLSAIVGMMVHRFDDREFTQFLLPSATLVVLLIWRELRMQSRTGNAARFATLFQLALPFGAGVALPVLLFLAPYVRSGSVGVLARGVFNIGARVQSLSLMRPWPARFLIPAVALIVIVVASTFWKRIGGPLFAIAVTLACTLLLLASFQSENITQQIWLSAALSTPLFVGLGAAVLLLPSFTDGIPHPRQQQLMLLLALAAVCGLVQFPFSAPIYFCYFAPLVILAAAAVISTGKRIANPLALASVLAFYVLFAVARVAPGVIYDNQGFKTSPVLTTLNLPRAGGLKVELARFNEAAVRAVLQHADTGVVIATPDIPDVYFLSGLRNPMSNDGALSSQDILRETEDDSVRVMVINGYSLFADSTLTPEVIYVVSTRFPYRKQIGKYSVCWR